MRFQDIHRGWWVLICILLIGFWLQLSGYNNGLVVTDWDEQRSYVEMLYRLEGGEALKNQTLVGYPPLRFVLLEAAHRLTADPTQPLLTPHLLPTIALIKLWTVCINAVTAVFLVLCGRLLNGWRVGLSAALIWIVLPAVTVNTVRALTEPWQVCAFTSASYFMLLALSCGKRWAALAATGAALMSFMFKSSSFPVFGLGIAVTLWQMRRAPRQWVMVLIVQCGLIAMAGLFSLQGAQAQIGVSHPETTRFFDGHLLDYLTNLSGLSYIWRSAAAQLSLRPYDIALTIAFVITGISLFLVPVNWKRVGLILICGLAVAHLVLVNAYLVWMEGIYRYTTPPSALWVLVIVTSVAWITQAMVGKGWRRTGHWLYAAGFLLWLIPIFGQSVKAVFLNTQPSTQEAYMRWVDSTLPKDGALLIARADWWSFSHIYWDKPVTRIWYQGVITDFSRQEWLDKGILYTTVTQYDLDQISSTEEGKHNLESLMRLKMFPRSGWAGENLYVYYLPDIESPIDKPVVFDNGMALLGCRLTDALEDNIHRLRIQCLWQAATAQTQAWKLYLHLVPPDSRAPLAQADGPLTLSSRPPQTWTDADEILVGEFYTIDIPQGVDMSSLKLLVGLYDEATGIRAQQNGLDYGELRLPFAMQEN